MTDSFIIKVIVFSTVFILSINYILSKLSFAREFRLRYNISTWLVQLYCFLDSK